MNEAARPINPMLLFLGIRVLELLFLTPFVGVAWNLGLQPSGIVSDTIGWSTNFGLAAAVMIVRNVVSAARPLPTQPMVIPLRNVHEAADD